MSGWQPAADSIERDRFTVGYLPRHGLQTNEGVDVKTARTINTAGALIGAIVWTVAWVLGIGYAVGWLSF